MNSIALSAGTIDYEDTGGTGPVLVLLHGLLMDSSLWDGVIAGLAGGCRCIAPTLPLGAHRRPMRADAELSLRAVAGLVAEFLERLELRNVTLAGNDTGGALAQLVVAAGRTDRVARIVLVSCDAFDNFPPGATGRALVATGRLPPVLFGLFMQQMRLRAVRRLPLAFGWLTRRGDAATARWITPLLEDARVRRDLVATLRTAAADAGALRAAAEALGRFEGPALVVWASEDRVMPPAHGRRLAALFPDGRLVEVADSYTLIPLDQPAVLARVIGDFLRSDATATTGARLHA